MAVLLYNTELRMAIADVPIFPEEGILDSPSNLCLPVEIDEIKTYYAKFYQNTIPGFFSEAKFFQKLPFPGNLWEINFGNYVGLTRIGPVCLKIQNKKISEELFQSLLLYIADKYANLIFSFASPVGQSHTKKGVGRDLAYIEYLFLKKALLDQSPNIDAVAGLVTSNPHRKLCKEDRINSIEAVQNVDPHLIMDIVSSTGNLARLRAAHALLDSSLGNKLYQKTGYPMYPTYVREERKYLSIDTNENRFLKFFLEGVQSKLEKLAIALRTARDGYLNPDIENNIAKLRQKIDYFLRAPLWKEVGRLTFIPANSQVLQRKEGYRQLYRLYALMQLVTRCDFRLDFENLLETKDTALLFEYWSFFLIKDILDHKLRIKSWRSIVNQSPSHLEEKIVTGLSLHYENNICLRFNCNYHGERESYSHLFCPDIVISKRDQKLIFDAKNKGEKRNRAGFYGEDEDGTIKSWKNEDINKMHAYRDAIENVTGAFILYPGIEEKIFPCHGAVEQYDGVGALPLRPKIGGKPVQKHFESVRRIINNFIKL